MFRVFLTLLVAVAGALALNNSPIIGIFTQPTDSTEGDCGGNCLYIPASYVKYIEASGGRVVPIDYYSSIEDLDKLLPKLNGVLFPGGDALFPQTAQHTFDTIKEFNDKGEHMPLWGTCMGFEWLLMSATRDANVLDPKSGQMDAYNLSIPLDFTSTMKKSKIFENAPVQIVDILSKQNVTMNNHHYGIWVDHFSSSPELSEFFNMLSTNKDRQGSEFVSMIEAYKYPIFGSQWHPEKNNFEWGETSEGIPNEGINHSHDAILASQYMANFFVDQARLSSHKFPTETEEDAALIYNYMPTKTTGSFMQEYFFHFPTQPNHPVTLIPAHGK
jgi:gamma-glutamyl hydrolase